MLSHFSEIPVPLEIRLFGIFELRVDGEVRDKVPAAVQGLLAQLVLHSASPVSRQQIASSIWPEVSSEQSSFYFRRALSQLRGLLGNQAGRIAGDLSINLEGCRCDLAEFLENVGTKPTVAVAAYTGALAVGKRNYAFEQISRGLAEKYHEALSRIAEQYEAEEDYASAIRVVRQLLGEDRSSEAAWRTLIRLLGIQKDHVGAARAFRQLRLALREELGIEPEPETTAVYNRVMAESDVLRVAPATTLPTRQTGPRLPTPLTPLLGREADLDAVRSALETYRVVFISGLGGVGKSRLAIEIAETWSPASALSLARVREAKELEEILAVDQLFPGESGSGEKQLLLLDNVEHLLELLRPAVEGLVASHPKLVILLTSRRNPGWPGTCGHKLAPLSVENEVSATASEMAQNAAIRLFVDRARSADSEFKLSARNIESVASICRKLDGLPLAIELAAAKVRSMPAAEIDRRLSDRFSLLTKQGSSRTLETVLDWSYEGLSDPARELFSQLVHMPGPWSYEACEVLGGPSVHQQLDALVELDLVSFQEGRYRCLHTVREYGHRKGTLDLDWVVRLAQFYFAEVESRFPTLQVATDFEAFEWFVQEEANLVWILQMESESQDKDYRRQALALFTHLYSYWMRTGRAAVGLRTGVCLVEAQDEPSEELTAALFSVGSLAHKMFQYDLAETMFTRADAMATNLGLRFWRAEALWRRAELLSDKSRFAEATELLRLALTEFEELGDEGKQAICLRNLGYVDRELGRFEDAISNTQKAFRIHVEANDVSGQSWCMGSLAATYFAAGDFQESSKYFMENIKAASARGDVYTQIWNLTMLAHAQMRLFEFGLAEKSVRSALAKFGSNPDPAPLEWPTSLLGEILTELGEYERADQTLERAWEIHSIVGGSKLGVYTMLRRAELHKRWGRPASARVYLEIAEDLGRNYEVSELVERGEAIRAGL